MAKNPSRGDVWIANLDPTRGHEQAGSRPVLIVSTDEFNRGPADMVIVVPLTGTDRGLPHHVQVGLPEGGLDRPSRLMTDMVRSISKWRLTRRLGAVAPETMAQVEGWRRILVDL